MSKRIPAVVSFGNELAAFITAAAMLARPESPCYVNEAEVDPEWYPYPYALSGAFDDCWSVAVVVVEDGTPCVRFFRDATKWEFARSRKRFLAAGQRKEDFEALGFDEWDRSDSLKVKQL